MRTSQHFYIDTTLKTIKLGNESSAQMDGESNVMISLLFLRLGEIESYKILLTVRPRPLAELLFIPGILVGQQIWKHVNNRQARLPKPSL